MVRGTEGEGDRVGTLSARAFRGTLTLVASIGSLRDPTDLSRGAGEVLLPVIPAGATRSTRSAAR